MVSTSAFPPLISAVTPHSAWAPDADRWLGDEDEEPLELLPTDTEIDEGGVGPADADDDDRFDLDLDLDPLAERASEEDDASFEDDDAASDEDELEMLDQPAAGDEPLDDEELGLGGPLAEELTSFGDEGATEIEEGAFDDPSIDLDNVSGAQPPASTPEDDDEFDPFAGETEPLDDDGPAGHVSGSALPHPDRADAVPGLPPRFLADCQRVEGKEHSP
jgi:hypothetical protein